MPADVPDLEAVATCLVLNRQRKHRVDTARLERFLYRLVEHLAPAHAFSVVLVSDRAIAGYNSTYRGIDKATDVLSFPGDGENLGDILISTEMAYAQAQRSPVLDFESNLDRLALHGLLHLMGYDHETDGGEMRAFELRLRRRFHC
jgi:probable rRNA maturation factor